MWGLSIGRSVVVTPRNIARYAGFTQQPRQGRKAMNDDSDSAAIRPSSATEPVHKKAAEGPEFAWQAMSSPMKSSRSRATVSCGKSSGTTGVVASERSASSLGPKTRRMSPKLCPPRRVRLSGSWPVGLHPLTDFGRSPGEGRARHASYVGDLDTPSIAKAGTCRHGGTFLTRSFQLRLGPIATTLASPFSDFSVMRAASWGSP